MSLPRGFLLLLENYSGEHLVIFVFKVIRLFCFCSKPFLKSWTWRSGYKAVFHPNICYILCPIFLDLRLFTKSEERAGVHIFRIFSSKNLFLKFPMDIFSPSLVAGLDKGLL
jgi:hypothetical protein